MRSINVSSTLVSFAANAAPPFGVDTTNPALPSGTFVIVICGAGASPPVSPRFRLGSCADSVTPKTPPALPRPLISVPKPPSPPTPTKPPSAAAVEPDAFMAYAQSWLPLLLTAPRTTPSTGTPSAASTSSTLSNEHGSMRSPEASAPVTFETSTLADPPDVEPPSPAPLIAGVVDPLGVGLPRCRFAWQAVSRSDVTTTVTTDARGRMRVIVSPSTQRNVAPDAARLAAPQGAS